MSTRGPAIKLLIFVAVTAVAGLGVVTVVGNLRYLPTNAYHAIFSDASGLGSGEEVRIGGVPSGEVTGVELAPNGTAVVAFTVDSAYSLDAGTRAAIRYKNLIGDRYLELLPGIRDAGPLEGPIPLERTSPALDIDQTVNGFRPLLQGLDPNQTNRLTASLIQVLNGQEAAVGELVALIGSLTNTLADRDAVIGAVITNFNTTLGTIHANSASLSRLIDGLQRLIGGLDGDQQQIVASLDRIDALSSAMSDVLADNRPTLGTEIATLENLTSALNNKTTTLNLVLSRLPEVYRLTGRAAGYGSFLNLFVCGIAVRYGSGPADVSPMFTAPAERCK
ncbi:MCE family protein [Nocardia cyriacigeorgica]|uniref:MCE family protein n=1 Tax=Nocardia cyriacigeorgica TaxID=135487 RepID=UPI0024583FE1|nr:MCE family protein [Nocardia cyriacigeorgica]